jgi:hypothetical protein
MKTIHVSFLGKVFNDQRGQMLAWVALAAVTIMTTGGLTVDVGHAYMVRTALQSDANAAALASVPYLFTTVNTTSTPSTVLKNVALQYSGAVSTDYNYNSSMGTLTPSVTTPCMDTLLANTTCSATGNVPNAVVVNLQAQVPTYFMSLIPGGPKTLLVGATATASPGGATQPWNLAIILDATHSMSSTDPNCSSMTYEQCALNGIMQMLTQINPCAGGVTSCNAASGQALIRVSLFSFPNVDTGSVNNDITCGGSATEDLYTLPKIPTSNGQLTGTAITSGANAGYVPIKYTPTTGSAWTATYQITLPSASPSTTDPDKYGFSSDFYPGSGGKQLNPNSTLVKAVGNVTTTGKSTTAGCLKPPTQIDSAYGHTYFASAIYAAQAALQAEKPVADAALATVYPGYGLTTTNGIIFISDGQAQVNPATANNRFPSAGSTASTASSAGVGGINVVYNNGNTAYTTGHNFTSTAATSPSTWGLYPDYNDPCQQAMTAAQFAYSKGTRVFGVAYGAETNGCLIGDSPYAGNDSNNSSAPLVVNATSSTATGYPASGYTMNLHLSSYSGIYPCVTIENIADTYVSPQGQGDFYAETSSNLVGGCSTTTMNTPLKNLATIFEAILSSLGNGPRLVPNQ